MQKYTIEFFLPCMAADVPEIAKELQDKIMAAFKNKN